MPFPLQTILLITVTTKAPTFSFGVYGFLLIAVRRAEGGATIMNRGTG
jgi:hypothetical protein